MAAAYRVLRENGRRCESSSRDRICRAPSSCRTASCCATCTSRSRSARTLPGWCEATLTGRAGRSTCAPSGVRMCAGRPCTAGEGERFLYLTWGDVGADGSFAMFRRAKLMVSDIEPEMLAAAARDDGVLVASLSLTTSAADPLRTRQATGDQLAPWLNARCPPSPASTLQARPRGPSHWSMGARVRAFVRGRRRALGSRPPRSDRVAGPAWVAVAL